MKQRTELRQQQRHEFNARFSGALQILQMPAVQLAEQIRDVLDSNPLLEEYATDESDTFETGAASLDFSSPAVAADSDALLEHAAQSRHSDSVHDYLLHQLRTAAFTGVQRRIAQAIVESVDERGYLVESLDELQQILAPQDNVSVAQIEQVLKVVQQFGPPGIAARNLSEALTQQLDVSVADFSTVARARQIVQHCLPLLAENRLDEICSLLDIDGSQLDAAVGLIRSLHPYPGFAFGSSAQTIMPDLIARKSNDKWQVQLNSEALPKLRISDEYRTMMNRIDHPEGRVFLKQNLSSATLFLDHVRRRHTTILRVAREVVRHQHVFLDVGEAGLKPLKIADVAQALDLHDSTVSRACAGKYIMTPRGTIELKRFFSVRIHNRDGSDESAASVRQKIVRIVGQESTITPLSDQQITERLRQGGTEISRRTVAKYRAELRIPARSQRARIISIS